MSPTIQAIEKKSDDAFVIRVDAPIGTDRAEVERSFQEKYDRQLALVETRYKELLQIREEQIVDYQQQNTNLTEVIKSLASRPIQLENIINNSQGDNNMTEGKKVYKHDDRRKITGVNGDIIENIEGDNIKYGSQPPQNLAEAAAEIQQLLEQLAQTYPTETLSQQAVVAETAIARIEGDPTWKQRAVAAIKASSIEALMELIDHPVANVLRAGIEKWKEPN